MPSSLTWIDHDSAARDRTQRILALFRERESRDELGLGGVYGSISDQLFPGTSTIQTRLRYMLFVPWIYRALPTKEGANRERLAKEAEQRLITELLGSADTKGVLGQRAREGLKRYPSDVYWAGLGIWGIRAFPGSRDELHHDVGAAAAWDPALPPPPSSFPQHAAFVLTLDEASYVRDKLRSIHRDSLLTHLALRDFAFEEVEAPWDLPEDALASNLTLVREAERFSVAMQGAAFLYNLMLAEKAANDDYRKHHRDELQKWCAGAGRLCREWKLDDFWPRVLDHGYGITFATRLFVSEWIGHVRQGSFDAVTSDAARRLVREREMRLKGAQSRFRSEKALQRWTGAAGIGLNTYRWRIARQYLADLHGAKD